MAEGVNRRRQPPFCAKVARPISGESSISVPDGGRPITFFLPHVQSRHALSSSALTGLVKLRAKELSALLRDIKWRSLDYERGTAKISKSGKIEEPQKVNGVLCGIRVELRKWIVGHFRGVVSKGCCRFWGGSAPEGQGRGLRGFKMVTR